MAAAQPIYEQLVALGFIDGVAKTVVRRAGGPAVAVRKRAAIDDIKRNPEMPEPGSLWEDCNWEFLCRLFEDLVPTVLSRSNLKSMAKKHAKVVPKEPLLRLLEFCLNIDPKSRVPAFEDYPTMVDDLQVKYVSLGCRAQNLTLPSVFRRGPAGELHLSCRGP